MFAVTTLNSESHNWAATVSNCCFTQINGLSTVSGAGRAMRNTNVFCFFLNLSILRTGQLKASHFDCSNSCGLVTAPSFPLCKKRNFHWSLRSAGQTVSLVTRFMQQHHMMAYHLASGTTKINKPMNKCNKKKTFCFPF